MFQVPIVRDFSLVEILVVDPETFRFFEFHSVLVLTQCRRGAEFCLLCWKCSKSHRLSKSVRTAPSSCNAPQDICNSKRLRKSWAGLIPKTPAYLHRHIFQSGTPNRVSCRRRKTNIQIFSPCWQSSKRYKLRYENLLVVRESFIVLFLVQIISVIENRRSSFRFWANGDGRKRDHPYGSFLCCKTDNHWRVFPPDVRADD